MLRRMREGIKRKCIKLYTCVDKACDTASGVVGWAGVVGLVYCMVAYHMVKDTYKHKRGCK